MALLSSVIASVAVIAAAVSTGAAPPRGAPLTEPYAVVVDPRGQLLVADGGSGRIVRVNPRTGRRTVFARRLGRVYDLAYGPGGLYASTSTKIWRFARGRRYAVVRGLHDPIGLAVASDKTIYVAESTTNRVLRFDGRTRRRSVVASTGLDQPTGLALLRDGSLVVSDSHHGRVVLVGDGGALTPVMEGLSLPFGLTPAAGGGVYVIDHVGHDAFGKIFLLRPDWAATTLSNGKIRALSGIAVTRRGVRYVTSFARPFLGRLDASGALRRLGTRAHSVQAQRARPRLLSGRIAFVSEPWKARVTYAGAKGPLRLVASQQSRRASKILRRSGSVWTGSLRLARQGRWRIAVRTRTKTLSLGTITAGYHVRAPVKIEAEPGGTLLVSDSGSGRILRLDPRTGIALSVAQGLTRLAAVATGPGGMLFALADEKLWQLEGAKPRLVVAFSSEGPTDLAPRGDGSVYVARYGARVDLVSPNGTVSTVAGGFDRPHGITLAGDGSILVADTYAGAVRRIAPSGLVTTIATGLAGPTDIAVAADGTLLVAEHHAGRISRIAAGGVSSVATTLQGPSGLAVAPGGSVFAADIDGGAVLAIDPNSGRVRRVSR